jgi:hypothetical protein
MQQLNPAEISDIIKSRIEGLDVKSEAQNEGTIVGVSDGIVRVHGLAEICGDELDAPARAPLQSRLKHPRSCLHFAPRT